MNYKDILLEVRLIVVSCLVCQMRISKNTKSLKDKRFNDMRKWVVQNLDKNFSFI